LTVHAYLEDIESAYVRTFRATVTARPPTGVVLDRTYFYAAGGGQASDRGTIVANGREFMVTDVVRSGSAVVHRLRRGGHGATDFGGLAAGQEVEGSLDWDRRFRHMRLHSGQHLLSARIFAQTGLRTRRATFEDRSGTIDLDGSWPASSTVLQLEEEMQALILEGHAISVAHLDRKAWEAAPDPRTGLVQLPAHLELIRLIVIDGLDRCPCGGTHVRSTREIGPLCLRLESLAGRDARMTFTLDGVSRPTPGA
jgi:misacylated tRNA(Ala) deacylase